MTITEILLATVAVVAGFLIVLGLLSPGDGWFPKLRDTSLDTYNFDFGVGQKVLSASEVTISETHQKEVDSLRSAITQMMAADAVDNSFYYLKDGFSSFEDGVAINAFEQGGNTHFVIQGGAGAEQTHQQFTIPGMKLCVIAGSSSVTSNFYDNFLSTATSTEEKELTEPYFTEVAQIQIAYNDPRLGFAENRIDYGEGFKDFEGDEWLFTPNRTHICFFPTVDGNKVCDGSKADGLDDDCFVDEEEKTSIPYRVENDLLNTPRKVAEGQEEVEDNTVVYAPPTAVGGVGSSRVY